MEEVTTLAPTSTRPPAPTPGVSETGATPVGGSITSVTRLLIDAAVVWVLGSGAVVVRLWDHGVQGQRAAIVIAVTALVALLAIAGARAWRLGRHTELAVAASAATLAGLVTWSSVGRSPIVVAVAATLLAEVAVSRRPLPNRDRSETRLLSLVPLVAASAVWARSGGLAGFAGWYVAGWGVVLLYPSLGLATVDRTLARLAPPLGRGARGAAAVGDRLGRWAMAGATAVGSGAMAVLRWALERARAGGRAIVARSNRPIVLSGVFVAIITAPTFHRVIAEPWIFIRGTNDVPGTIERVHWMRFWPLRMPVPHPGWSLTVKAFMEVVGEVAAVTIVLAASTGLATAVVILIGRSRWDGLPALGWPLACALGIGYVLLENPAVLMPAGEGWWNRFGVSNEFARGSGYLPFHLWATPTITMSMPLVFALFVFVLRVLDDVESGSPLLRRHERSLAVLTVVGTLVQPATTLALLPAVPTLLLLTRRLDRRSAAAASWFVVPGALVCLGQVWFLSSNVSPWEQATWRWDPFWTLDHFGLDRPIMWATLGFYPLCIWAGGRRYLADRAVRLSFLAAVISWVPFLMLEQTTIAPVPDGDLGVMPMMAMILLFVSSLRFVFIEVQARWPEWVASRRTPPAWMFAIGAFLALMLCAGVVDLLSASGTIAEI